MDPVVFGSAFSLIFLAEMGDKSQLIAMTLAHRYRPVPVVAGVFTAFAMLNLLAVWVGQVLFRWVPQGPVLLAAAALFLVFAYRSWRDGAQAEAAPDAAPSHGGVVLTSFSLIFLSEFGDKTQIATIALAAGTGQPWSVFAGSTLALWSVSLIGILVGCTLFARLPRLWVHRTAAVLFALFGVLALFEAVSGDAARLLGGPMAG
jgi:putative Ca2+/H+ antiporter (TMEM165/GDT1 family)